MRRVLVALLLSALQSAALAAGVLRHGQEPPAGVGGPIDLIDQRGAPFSLQRVAGKPALVFFGLIQCGSTCPVAFGTARQVLAGFEPGDTPNVLFVTLDPLSDGPAELQRVLANIDTRLIGLTGDPTRVERTAERYGVATRMRVGGVDHSSMWYLLDGAGRLRRVYSYTTPAPQLVADLRSLLDR